MVARMDGTSSMSRLRSRNILRARPQRTDERESPQSEEDMFGLSSETRMSQGQSDSTLWDIRRAHTRGTPEYYRRESEKDQRIFALRGALRATRDDIQAFGKGTTSARRKEAISEIVKRIDDTLGDIEWTVVKEL